jgi:hypothetical protein
VVSGTNVERSRRQVWPEAVEQARHRTRIALVSRASSATVARRLCA